MQGSLLCDHAGMSKHSKTARAALVIVALFVGSAAHALTYSCTLEGVGKGKAFVPEWLEAQIDPVWGNVSILDSVLDAKGKAAIPGEIARETPEQLSLIWKGYAVNAGFNRNPIRPRLRLSILKSSGAARMTSTVPKGAKALRAEGSCKLVG